MRSEDLADEPKEGDYVEHDATITQTHKFGDQIDHLSNYQLERGLKSRHIQYAHMNRIETSLLIRT